jgi:uncharacterized protein (TIGR02246 family)
MRYSLVFFLAIAWLSMPQAAKAEKPASAAERHAVEQAMRDYAKTLRVGTPDEVAACYTADGELLLPGLDPLHGREAIRAFLAPLAAATEVESVDIESQLVEVHGKSANQWGKYRQVAGEKGKTKQQFRGRFASLWHRESDGRWRLVRLMMQPL